MFLHGPFKVFLSLTLGYVLCVLAKKQQGLLKTLGYTLGIAIFVLTSLYVLVTADIIKCGLVGLDKICGPLSKFCPFSR